MPGAVCLADPAGQIHQLFGVPPERQHWFRFVKLHNGSFRPTRYLTQQLCRRPLAEIKKALGLCLIDAPPQFDHKFGPLLSGKQSEVRFRGQAPVSVSPAQRRAALLSIKWFDVDKQCLQLLGMHACSVDDTLSTVLGSVCPAFQLPGVVAEDVLAVHEDTFEEKDPVSFLNQKQTVRKLSLQSGDIVVAQVQGQCWLHHLTMSAAATPAESPQSRCCSSPNGTACFRCFQQHRSKKLAACGGGEVPDFGSGVRQAAVCCNERGSHARDLRVERRRQAPTQVLSASDCMRVRAALLQRLLLTRRDSTVEDYLSLLSERVVVSVNPLSAPNSGRSALSGAWLSVVQG